MLKNILLCTVAAAALATSSAFAADMPVKARPTPLPAAWSWAGFYLGAHGGYGWKRNDFADVLATNPIVTIDGIDSKGWVLGGHLGYNWQYDRWVVGVEVDGSATRIRGSNTVVQPGGFTFTTIRSDEVKYLGTARARFGVVPFTGWDALLYGTAGLAWERVNRTATSGVAVVGASETNRTTTPRDHFGWVAGIGGELRIGGTNWIARIEYLHYDFGTVEESIVSTNNANPIFSFADNGGRQTIDVVRGALSYKFDVASPSSPLSAFAADMPVKARPAPPAGVWSWAGFYLGAHGGYGWKRNDFSDYFLLTPPLTIGGIDSRGWVVGGHAGHNWQYGRWVLGVELDLSAARIRGDSDPVVQNPVGGTITNIAGDDVRYLGTARGRFGVVPFANADALLYGTAGLAWERVVRTDTIAVITPGFSSTSVAKTPRDHFGWVAGVGGEVRVGSTDWIARVEYLHYDFGTVEPASATTVVPPNPAVSFADSGGRQTIDVVRGALSYKFSGGVVSAAVSNMPVKAPVLVQAWSWTGFYLGAHGGYGWKQNDSVGVIQINPTVTIGGIDSNGWVVGGQAGYNWQYDRWVLGLEMDFSATRIRGDSDPAVRTAGALTVTETRGDDVKYLGSARARFGVVPFTSWDALLYGTAGLAWERADRIVTLTTVGPGVAATAVITTPRDHFGWVAGAGGELRISGTNWIARAEYLHYDFGTVEQTFSSTTSAPGASFADKGGRQTIDVVRGALSYKFSAAR